MALAVAVALSGCDKPPPVQANARRVTVVGSGQVQGTPDTLTADVGIEVVAPDVTAAMNQTNERPDVIAALTADGIDTEDISTAAVTPQPQYGDNQRVTGYRAGNSLNVKIRRLDNVHPGVDRHRQRGRQCSPDQFGELLHRRRFEAGLRRPRAAFEDAKNRATQYAQLSGMSLGRIISIRRHREPSRRGRLRRRPARWPPTSRCNPAGRPSASR